MLVAGGLERSLEVPDQPADAVGDRQVCGQVDSTAWSRGGAMMPARPVDHVLEAIVRAVAAQRGALG